MYLNITQTKIMLTSFRTTSNTSDVRRKFSWGGFIQWQIVVICISGALFVTTQSDVIFINRSLLT